MKRIYFLSSCDKCKRILNQTENLGDFQLIDLKKEMIDSNTLDFLYSKVNSYERLFNKRAQKFTGKIKESITTDLDYRDLILTEYTFLKRPIMINESEVKIEKISD